MISLKYLQRNIRITLRVYVVLEMVLIIQRIETGMLKYCLCVQSVHVYQCVFRGPSSCQLVWYSTHSTTIKSIEKINCLWAFSNKHIWNNHWHRTKKTTLNRKLQVNKILNLKQDWHKKYQNYNTDPISVISVKNDDKKQLNTLQLKC